MTVFYLVLYIVHKKTLLWWQFCGVCLQVLHMILKGVKLHESENLIPRYWWICKGSTGESTDEHLMLGYWEVRPHWFVFFKDLPDFSFHSWGCFPKSSWLTLWFFLACLQPLILYGVFSNLIQAKVVWYLENTEGQYLFCDEFSWVAIRRQLLPLDLVYFLHISKPAFPNQVKS